MRVRLLTVIPQLPQDPASGAARSVRTICEMLAGSGAEVRVVATTATEAARRSEAGRCLREFGIDLCFDTGKASSYRRPEYEFVSEEVRYRLLDTSEFTLVDWPEVYGRQFDEMFDDELRLFRPDLLFGFGGLPGDVKRFERARARRVKTVFALRNRAYLAGRSFLSTMDGLLTPSQFLTNFYRNSIGLESTPLPTPINSFDVIAERRDPVFFTMINPSPEKGLMFVARLAQELSVCRSDIPLLIVESRGGVNGLVQAGMLGGFDLRHHQNLMVSPMIPRPKDIYLPTRVLLVPSLWQEPAGRVAAEAMLNGIPPLVSDRGGLPEQCNGGGLCLPIPPEYTERYPRPVDKEIVEPWLASIFRLADDEEFYINEAQRALNAAVPYRIENLLPRYLEYFDAILQS